MAHKKKGAKKAGSPTQANGTASKDAPPATFKEAVLKNVEEDGAGHAMNGHAEEAPPAPKNDAPETPAAAAPQAHAGTQAQRDSQKALEQTVDNLRGDLRAECSRREHAEASLFVYKAATLSLGVSTLGFAALALLATSRCSSSSK